MTIQITNPIAGYTDIDRQTFVCADHRNVNNNCVYPVTDKNRPTIECRGCLDHLPTDREQAEAENHNHTPDEGGSL